MYTPFYNRFLQQFLNLRNDYLIIQFFHFKRWQDVTKCKPKWMILDDMDQQKDNIPQECERKLDITDMTEVEIIHK